MDIEFENKYENKPNFAGFNVIGVGLPGTGEASMKWALSWLLEGACYDITKYLHHGVQQRKVLHKYIIYCNNIRYHFKSNVHHDHLPLYCKRHFCNCKVLLPDPWLIYFIGGNFYDFHQHVFQQIPKFLDPLNEHGWTFWKEEDLEQELDSQLHYFTSKFYIPREMYFCTSRNIMV